MKTLHQLNRGKRARIVQVHGEGDSTIRLQSMGILPGRWISHCNTAPLGDPIAFHIDGQKISMRQREAMLVELE